MAVVAALSFTVTGAATAYVRLNNNTETHDLTAQLGDDRPVHIAPVDPEDPNAGTPLNILIMGSDDRSGTNAAIGGEVAGMRSDTTIVVHISADRQRMDLVSIPRDSHVEIPACPRADGTASRARADRFNTAFAIGADTGEIGDAAACTIKTVESLTGVPIDRWMIVDFSGFINMVDALEGIPICIPNEMRAPDAGLHVQAGNQVLDGRTALAFARARTGVGVGDGSDTNRLGRQQQLLAATARQVTSQNLLTDSTKLFRFLDAATESLTADTQTGDLRNLAGLAFSLKNIPPGNITFMTIPFAAYAPDKNQVVWTDEAEGIWANMAADAPLITPQPAQTPVPVETPARGATAPATTAPATTEPAEPAEPPKPPKPGVDPFTPDDVTAVCG